MISNDPYVRLMRLSWRQDAKYGVGDHAKVVLCFNTLNGSSKGFRAVGVTLEGEVVGNRSGDTRDDAMKHLLSVLGSNCIHEDMAKIALVPFMEHQKCSYNTRVSQKICFLNGAAENVSDEILWAINEHSIATTRNSENPGNKSKYARKQRKLNAPVANVVRDTQHGKNIAVLASDASTDSTGRTSYAWLSSDGSHGGGVIEGVTCNNKAEFIAIAHAFVNGFKKNKHDGAIIYSDSQSSVNQYNKYANGDIDVELTQKQMKTVEAIRSGFLKLQWIPSHTGLQGAAYRLNRQADNLASFYRTTGRNGFYQRRVKEVIRQEFEVGFAHDYDAIMISEDSSVKEGKIALAA